MWCVSHLCCITMFILCAVCSLRPRVYWLWPMLSQQSVYDVGLLVLVLAALPKVLPILLGDVRITWVLFFKLLAFTFGAGLNFALLYIAFHWYWYVETLWVKTVRNDPSIVRADF